MATICQLHADLRYYLCMEPVDMRKQFQGLQGIVNVSKAESSGNLFTLPRPGNVTESNAEFGRYLTQDEGTFTTASGDSPVPVRTDGHRQSVLFIEKLQYAEIQGVCEKACTVHCEASLWMSGRASDGLCGDVFHRGRPLVETSKKTSKKMQKYFANPFHFMGPFSRLTIRASSSGFGLSKT